MPISELHNDPANVRLHNEKNLKAITASLKTFGQVEPLVVQRGTGKVIGGNARLTTMIEMGLTECDVVEVDIDNVSAVALGIALNRSAELAEWDTPALVRTLGALRDEGADMEGTGFTADDMTSIISQLGSMTPDAAEPEAPQEFPEKDESIDVEHTCPKCGYCWSGGE